MRLRDRFAWLAGVIVLCAGASTGFAAAAPPLTPEAPAGANDVSCRPNAAHPEPVVLVHGSGSDPVRSFAVLAPALRAAGYCVFAAPIGAAPALPEAVAATAGSSGPGLGAIGATLAGRPIYGVADIRAMAGEVAQVVRTVRASTGAARVALLGHSTGGTVIRQYLREQGGTEVATVVTLGAPYRGSTWRGLAAAYPDLAGLGLTGAQIAAQVFGPPGKQQLPDAPLLAELNARGETESGIRYTAIASRTDEIITPADSALLSAPTGDSRNVWLQDGCPANTATHSGILEDPRSIELVLTALGSQGRELPC